MSDTNAQATVYNSLFRNPALPVSVLAGVTGAPARDVRRWRNEFGVVYNLHPAGAVFLEERRQLALKAYGTPNVHDLADRLWVPVRQVRAWFAEEKARRDAEPFTEDEIDLAFGLLDAGKSTATVRTVLDAPRPKVAELYQEYKRLRKLLAGASHRKRE